MTNLTRAAATAAFALGVASLTLPAAAASTVDVAASNFQFAPNTIVAHVGVPTTLRLTSKGGVHGIQSKELGIPATTLLPGKTVTVTFTPTKAGDFKVNCSVPCGPGHNDMVLDVKVES